MSDSRRRQQELLWSKLVMATVGVSGCKSSGKLRGLQGPGDVKRLEAGSWETTGRSRKLQPMGATAKQTKMLMSSRGFSLRSLMYAVSEYALLTKSSSPNLI